MPPRRRALLRQAARLASDGRRPPAQAARPPRHRSGQMAGGAARAGISEARERARASGHVRMTDLELAKFLGIADDPRWPAAIAGLSPEKRAWFEQLADV